MTLKRPLDQFAGVQEPIQKINGLIWQELNANQDLIETWNWINNQWQSNLKSFFGSIYFSDTQNIWGLPVASLYNYELINFFTQVGNPATQNWSPGQILNYDVFRGDSNGATAVSAGSTVGLPSGTYSNGITGYQGVKFVSNGTSFLQVRALPTNNVTYNFVFQLNYKLIRK